MLHVSNTTLGHNGHTIIAGGDGSLDLTEKPGAVGLLTPGPREKVLLPESSSSADYLTVSVLPPCAIACINTCAHVKNSQTRAAVPLIEHTQNAAHTGRSGYMALLLRLLCLITQVRRPEFPARDNEVLMG